MGSSVQARGLLLRIMGVDAEDADVPMTVLVNMYRAKLQAPLVRLDETYGGRAESPWLRASLIVHKVEQRWPSLKDGELFHTDPVLSSLVKKLPARQVGDTTRMLELARNPTPMVAELLRMDWDDWTCFEPLILLREMTHQNVDASELETYEGLLARELELDPAVLELINEMAGLT